MANAATKPTPAKNQGNFIHDVLSGIGAPYTLQNFELMVAWMRGEGTSAAFNPLATTQPYPGATNFNSVGVKNYPSYDAGVQATVQTLNNGRYPGIVNDLRKGNVPPAQIATNNSSEFDTWGTGGAHVAAIASGIQDPRTGVAGVLNHPIAGVQAVPGDVQHALEKPLSDVGSYLLYGFAFLGGGLLLITGLILIGADVGLAVFARTKTAQRGSGIVATIGGRKERKATQERQRRTTERADQIQESKARTQAHREAVARARVRQERAKARREEGTVPRKNTARKGENITSSRKGEAIIVTKSGATKQVNTRTGEEIPF